MEIFLSITKFTCLGLVFLVMFTVEESSGIYQMFSRMRSIRKGNFLKSMKERRRRREGNLNQVLYFIDYVILYNGDGQSLDRGYRLLFEGGRRQGLTSANILSYADIPLLRSPEVLDVPMFGGLINNVTVSVTRDATLSCIVENLSSYKVAWLRVDTQTILTIAGHVITKNHRIGITHSDQRTWSLQIKDVRESDQGWYMCQLNTDPMKSQTAHLQVVVPPDILDYPTSMDMIVREGKDVTLRCAASGSPTPTVAWRRESARGISLGNGSYVQTVEGNILHIPQVTRHDMGAYLCIASNGIPPTVSKRILLIVHFPPNIWTGKQLVGAVENQAVILECHAEAFPRAINYWVKGKGEILNEGPKYKPIFEETSYKVVMKLIIKNVTSKDFGTYKCVSKNSLGDTEGSTKLYPVPYSAVISRNSTISEIKKTRGHRFNGVSEYLGNSGVTLCQSLHLLILFISMRLALDHKGYRAIEE